MPNQFTSKRYLEAVKIIEKIQKKQAVFIIQPKKSNKINKLTKSIK